MLWCEKRQFLHNYIIHRIGYNKPGQEEALLDCMSEFDSYEVTIYLLKLE